MAVTAARQEELFKKDLCGNRHLTEQGAKVGGGETDVVEHYLEAVVAETLLQHNS